MNFESLKFMETKKENLSELFKLSKGIEKPMDYETLDKSLALQIDHCEKYSSIDKRMDAVEEKNDSLENTTRELTDDEVLILCEKLGWSEKKIREKCTIDQEGVIHLKTDCQDKEGKKADCGIPYERKRIEYNGVEIEGVFAEFDSKFDVQLDEENYQSSSTKQFSECNKKLKEEIEKNPELKSQFSKEQIEDIRNGRTPRGYTWHHNEEPGKMQLVKTEEHDRRIGGAAHTGGNSIWGNKSIEKNNDEQKGVKF